MTQIIAFYMGLNFFFMSNMICGPWETSALALWFMEEKKWSGRRALHTKLIRRSDRFIAAYIWGCNAPTSKYQSTFL